MYPEIVYPDALKWIDRLISQISFGLRGWLNRKRSEIPGADAHRAICATISGHNGCGRVARFLLHRHAIDGRSHAGSGFGVFAPGVSRARGAMWGKLLEMERVGDEWVTFQVKGSR